MAASTDPRFDLRRRHLLIGLAALASLPLLPGKSFAATVNTLSFDEFYCLCVRLTGFDAPDRETMQKFYALFQQEPWGIDHLLRVRAKLHAAPPGELPDVDKPLDVAALDDGERWFTGHLLTTLYTGSYYHQSGNKVIAYQHALMFDALSDIRPTPGYSDRDFGFWAEQPEGVRP